MHGGRDVVLTAEARAEIGQPQHAAGTHVGASTHAPVAANEIELIALPEDRLGVCRR